MTMHAQGLKTENNSSKNKRQRIENDDEDKAMTEPPTKRQKTTTSLLEEDEQYLKVPKNPKIPKQFEELAIVQSTDSTESSSTSNNDIPPMPMLEPLPKKKQIKRTRSRPKKKSNKKRKKQRKRKDIIAENEKALTDDDRKEMQRICDKLGICDGYNVGVCLYHFDSHPEVYRFIEKVYDENNFDVIQSKVFDFVRDVKSHLNVRGPFILATMKENIEKKFKELKAANEELRKCPNQ